MLSAAAACSPSAAWVEANSSNMVGLHAEQLLVVGRLGDGLVERLAHLLEDLLARPCARMPSTLRKPWAMSVTSALATSKFRRAVCSACQARMPATVAPTASTANNTAVAAIRRWRNRARLPEAAMKPSVGAPSSPGIALGDALGLGERHALGDEQVALLAALLPAPAQRLDIVSDAVELGIGGDDLLGALPVLQHALMREPDRGVLLAAGGEQDARIDQRLDQALGGRVVGGLGERHRADRERGGRSRFTGRRRRRKLAEQPGQALVLVLAERARWRALPPCRWRRRGRRACRRP